MTMRIMFTDEEIAEVEEDAMMEQVELEEAGIADARSNVDFFRNAAFCHAVMAIHDSGMIDGVVVVEDYEFKVKDSWIVN